MKERIGRVAFLLLALCGIWGGGSRTVQAAGAGVAIQTESVTQAVGDVFYVVITISSTDQMNGFEGYFRYDQSKIKYITGGSVSSGNDDVFFISDTGREEGTTRLKYSIKFKARKPGYVTIELQEPYRAYLAEDSSRMSVASSALTMHIVKKGTEKKQTPEPAEEGKNQPEDVQASPVLPDPTDGMTAAPTEEASDSVTKEAFSDADNGQPTSLPEKTDGRENAVADESLQKDNGLSATTCVIVIILSFIGLCILIYRLCRPTDHYYEDEEEESTDEMDAGEKRIRDTENEPESWSEEAAGETMEEIEKRLEEKRRKYES